uniref:Uncharacterized protein n=1 Tax=Romanomermis culicivorax TaxID=13658 RepID=A0A915IAT1_ROMCU
MNRVKSLIRLSSSVLNYTLQYESQFQNFALVVPAFSNLEINKPILERAYTFNTYCSPSSCSGFSSSSRYLLTMRTWWACPPIHEQKYEPGLT